MKPCASKHDNDIAYRSGMEDGYHVAYLQNVWPGINLEAYVAGYRFGVQWADLASKWRAIARDLEPDPACSLPQ